MSKRGEAEVSSEPPFDLTDAVRDHEKRISALENLFKENPAIATKKVSVNEFLREKDPQTDTDKALAIAYHLEYAEGLTNFNVEDIRIGFRRAASPVPPNLSETVRKNIAKGFLMDSGAKKGGSTSWIVTGSGKTYVESNFNRKRP